MKTNLAMAVAGLSMLRRVFRPRAHHTFAAEFDAKKPVHLVGT